MTGAADPGFIASLTTVHLLLLAATAAAVIFVMLIAARRRRAATKAAEAGDRRREEALDVADARDDAGHDTDPTGAAGPAPSTQAPPGSARVAAPTAPPPPPLAADEPPIAPSSPAPTGRMTADAPDSDELTQMKGVGPKLAQRLNELGYTRFAQIAALKPDEAQRLDAELGSFQGRMARDRWIEQAGFLARGDRAGYEAVFGRL